jgi:PHP family Zn ribbon phosphoesterase
MQIIADLHIHSKFSRAVSPEMTIPNIAAWANRKGIDLVATGDWTHPMWFREIEKNLEETGNGLLQLSDKVINENFVRSQRNNNFPHFILGTEISCIYSQAGKGRRIHTLVYVPTLESARKIGQEMTKRGCNLLSDGRPIIPLTSIQLAELVLEVEPKALIIPAHAWTPWFSVYGSMSGFKSITEAFGPYAKNIYAVETGLSSSPDMNWRIKELDFRSIISSSDAHSGPKLGREATVFEIPEGKLGYDVIYETIKIDAKALLANENLDPSSVANIASPSPTSLRASEAGQNFISSSPEINKKQNLVHSLPKNKSYIAYTIEFYPEEGKYHYTGHRTCNIRYDSAEIKKKGTSCPVCGKPLTQGVMQRVEDLAGRSESELRIKNAELRINNKTEIRMIKSEAFPNRPPFCMLVPLQEIISECIGSPVTSTKTQVIYTKLTDELNGEFNVLLNASHAEIHEIAGSRVAEAIDKVRVGDIMIDPGYDGVFGVVKIWKKGEQKPLVDDSKEQLSIF